jgi:hypothetical protein
MHQSVCVCVCVCECVCVCVYVCERERERERERDKERTLKEHLLFNKILQATLSIQCKVTQTLQTLPDSVLN